MTLGSFIVGFLSDHVFHGPTGVAGNLGGHRLRRLLDTRAPGRDPRAQILWRPQEQRSSASRTRAA